VRQQQFEYAYLFGAVCPANGHTEAIIAPFSNSEIMREHLALISKATASDRHAVVIMDGASWHQHYLANDFDNLSIIKLPPYSPELNPVEQVWQWMRQNEIANRCFDGYEDIVNQCEKAWNRFREDKCRVTKPCYRDWISLIS
jgi:transposase